MNLLRRKTPQELWDLHRTDFLKIYSQESRKPITHAKLVKRFVDSNGMQIYGYPTDTMLPVDRYSMLTEYLSYIAKGMSAKEEEEMDDAMELILTEGIKNNKGAARIGTIIEHRRKRRRLGVHTELFYNYLAVQLVREDEDPETFDNDMQLLKVAQFKEEVKKKGSWSFFQVPEFKRLNDLLKLSPPEWAASWDESLLQQKALPEILKIITSSPLSPVKGKTLEVK